MDEEEHDEPQSQDGLYRTHGGHNRDHSSRLIIECDQPIRLFVYSDKLAFFVVRVHLSIDVNAPFSLSKRLSQKKEYGMVTLKNDSHVLMEGNFTIPNDLDLSVSKPVIRTTRLCACVRVRIEWR